MISKDDYIMRIQLASPARLVVINYEIIEAFLLEALDALAAEEQNGQTEKSRWVQGDGQQDTAQTTFEYFVEKAKNALTQLIRALNFEIAIAQDLYQIYQYIEKLLTAAFFSHNREAAVEALSLIRILLASWREVAANEAEDEQPAAGGAPQVYAGLTYARDGLAEYVVQDDKRGFKV